MKRRDIYIALFVCSLIVALAAAFASANQDGFEWVSKGLGFAAPAEDSGALAPFGSYEVPAIGQSFLSTFIAGVIGISAVFIVVMLAGRIIGGRRRQITQKT
jgi:predicted membrane-bound dolichyl-phosphate-mannose-protein mannosyltransferase